MKVNDVNANPIDIAAVVVWRVYDAAEAMFEVENYGHYVQIQSEAALREMATKYPYDAIEEKDIGGITLSSHQDEIAKQLQQSVEARLARAAYKYWRLESLTLLILQKLHKQCCAASKRVQSLQHVVRLSTEQSAWSNLRYSNYRLKESLNLMKTRKQPWLVIC